MFGFFHCAVLSYTCASSACHTILPTSGRNAYLHLAIRCPGIEKRRACFPTCVLPSVLLQSGQSEWSAVYVRRHLLCMIQTKTVVADELAIIRGMIAILNLSRLNFTFLPPEQPRTDYLCPSCVFSDSICPCKEDSLCLYIVNLLLWTWQLRSTYCSELFGPAPFCAMLSKPLYQARPNIVGAAWVKAIE